MEFRAPGHIWSSDEKYQYHWNITEKKVWKIVIIARHPEIQLDSSYTNKSLIISRPLESKSPEKGSWRHFWSIFFVSDSVWPH